MAARAWDVATLQHATTKSMAFGDLVNPRRTSTTYVSTSCLTTTATAHVYQHSTVSGCAEALQSQTSVGFVTAMAKVALVAW